MIVGITNEQHSIIVSLLEKYFDKYSFYYYGSRVKGKFNKTSDLDVLIKGNSEIPLTDLSELKEAFDASKLPFIVNFTDYNTIDSSFYDLIKPDLVLVKPES